MQQLTLTALRFVGGPFDGFSQQFFDDPSELPKAVALPINQRTSRLFGMKCEESDREAIYVLHTDLETVRYQFRNVRRIVRPKAA